MNLDPSWAGPRLALATYLVVVLACVLTNTPTLGNMGPLWVILAAMAGYSGSKFRTRNRALSRVMSYRTPAGKR